MTMSNDPFTEPETTREEILAAAYRALRTRGYGDVTISAIGEEFEKSPSLIYRHYDSKDDLIVECLEYLLDRFESQQIDAEIEDPRDRLDAFVRTSLVEEIPDDDRQFVATLVELRARAVHDEAYRRHFTESDRALKQYLASILRSGIDSGEFLECDPGRVAETLLVMITGVAIRRSTTTDEAWIPAVRAEIDSYLEERVYAERADRSTE